MRNIFLLFISLAVFGKEQILLKQDFESSTSGWSCPAAWPGNLSLKDGKLLLSSTVKGREHCGQCMRSLNQLVNLSGCRFKLAFTVSGTGTFRIGTEITAEPRGKSHIVWHGRVELKETAKRIEKEIDFSRTQVYRMNLILRVDGNSEVAFDDMEFSQLSPDGLHIEKPFFPVLRKSEFTGIPVVTDSPGKKLTVFCNGDIFDVETDAEGKAEISGQKITLADDGSSIVTVAADGLSATAKISVTPDPVYEKALSLARKITGRNPSLRIVWFGDSELDFDRDCNTPAKIDYYLNAARPGSSVFQNFAVAGDSTHRLAARLYGEPVNSIDRFKEVGTMPADLIFVELGLNDTVSFSTDGFQTPAVKPAEVRTNSRRIFGKLKQLYPEARFILLSPPALDHEFLRKKADAQLAAGRKEAYWFGSPKLLDDFCRIWKDTGAEFGFEYLDMYTDMKDIADRMKFFKPGDEVHFNASGHDWLTERILEYLERNPDKKKQADSGASDDFRFRFSALKNGKISQGTKILRVVGKETADADGALEMNGKTDEAFVTGLGKITQTKGFSAELVCKPGQPEGNDRSNLICDALICRPGSFCLGRDNRSFCLYHYQDGKMQRLYTGRPVFPEKSNQFHHIAFTCRFHSAPDQGEIWTEIRIWLNGKKVEDKKFDGVRFPEGSDLWVIGNAAMLGKAWHLGGELLGGGIYPRVLNETEVRRHVLNYVPQVTPAFRYPAELTSEQIKLLQNAELTEAERAACMNLAGRRLPDWEKILDSPRKFLLTLGEQQYRLVLLSMPGKARVVSFYDTVGKRDLLNWNNCFFQLVFQRRGEYFSVTMPEMENDLTAPPETRNGITEFSFRHTRRDFPALEGSSHWRFNGSRLEYTLDIASKSPETVIFKAGFPHLNLTSLNHGTDYLVVPQAGGLLYENAAQRAITYSSTYPRMMTSMQCGAVYDKDGGIYFSPADPRGRVKDFRYETDTSETSVCIDNPVAFDPDRKSNRFTPGNFAVMEAFRGDWYDAGMLYRGELARTEAVWWRKNLPNTDTPEWFRNNTLKLSCRFFPDDKTEDFIKLRKYLELPYVIFYHFWGEGKGDAHRENPMIRTNLEFIEHAKFLREYGIRVKPYTNGRLWSSLDRHCESFFYPDKGLEGAVRDPDGKPVLELYGGIPCAVLCPSTEIYQKVMPDMVIRLASQGLPDCYVDQLGAARPVLCFSPNHGHRLNDPDSWNINGHRKAFLKVRKFWRENGMDGFMSTEDNSEHCVGLMDAMHPWRLMHDNQIPLHMLVYSGRTQYISRDCAQSDESSIYPKAAVQLVQGEQLSEYQILDLTSASQGTFRRYLKRLMHLRFAVCDFFNEGIMERAPRFVEPMKKIYTKWGRHGTQYVGTLPVVAGQWKLGDNRILLLINTTGAAQAGTLAEEPEQRLCILNSSGEEMPGQSKFNLRPYACELRIYGPELKQELKERIKKSYRIIVRSETEADPFSLLAQLPADPCNFSAVDRQEAFHSPFISGARVNEELQRLDYVSFALIYAGTGDFGAISEGLFEFEISAPGISSGGEIQVILDHPDQGKLAGTLELDRKEVLTRDWQDYRNFRFKANFPIGGKHAVFIRINGKSACNFRSWRWIPGGEK